jgi:hypothetical protein
MPFTNPDFPGQLFANLRELEDAKQRRTKTEESIAEDATKITEVTATILPAPKDALERKIATLEHRMEETCTTIHTLLGYSNRKATHNKEGLKIGIILRGESKGRQFTLEVLDDQYLCSDGRIYPSLSAAAEGTSGNRRSGWKFWRDVEGTPIGEVSGRFKQNDSRHFLNPRHMY